MKTPGLFLLLLTFLAVGCGGSGPATAPTPQWIVHGDPGAFLAGATGEAVIPVERLRGLENWQLFQMGSFAPKSSVLQSRNLVRGQDPARRKAQLVRVAPLVIEENETMIRLQDPAADLSFQFAKRGGQAVLEAVNGRAARLIHVSVDETVHAVSLLWADRALGTLTSAYFSLTRSSVTDGIEPGERGEYHFISRQRARWQGGKARLGLCGLDPATKEAAVAAAGKWQAALRGLLTIEITDHGSNYPPYSDLGTHCVYAVDDYLFTPTSRQIMLGLTVIPEHLGFSGWIDGDIFLLKKEFAKIGAADRHGRALAFTLVHEIGHWLGLDHLPHGGQDTESVMNYRGLAELSDYDKKAIRELYRKN